MNIEYEYEPAGLPSELLTSIDIAYSQYINMATMKGSGPLASVCAICSRLRVQPRTFSTTLRSRYASGESHLPKVATPSFWASMIPRSLRSSNAQSSHKKVTREWNPATPFIFLAILVGSNAINLIALRNEMLAFSRKTDAKLGLLREVVQRIKDGEEVDVKRLLGTGDEKTEKEWEDVMQELEETDMLAEGRRKREMKRLQKAREKEEAVAADELRKKKGLDDVQGESGKGSGEKAGSRSKFIM